MTAVHAHGKVGTAARERRGGVKTTPPHSSSSICPRPVAGAAPAV